MRIRIFLLLIVLMILPLAVSSIDNNIERLFALGDSLTNAANYDSAVVVLNEGLVLAEARYGLVDTTVAQGLVYLGIANFYKGQFEKSKEYWTRSLDIRKEVLGLEHAETAHSMTLIAILYDQLGSPSEAVPVYEQVLAIYDKLKNPPPSKVADCAQNLAISYLKLGQLELTKKYFLQAIEYYEKAEGPNGHGVGVCTTNLALIHHQNGEYAEALVMFQRALRILEETKGKNHPDVANTVENIANTYLTLGNDEDAGRYYARALAIKKTTLGPEHPDVATAMSNLANLYFQQRKYDEAEPLLTEALAIVEKAYGSDHADVAYITSQLANIYMRRGQYAESEKYHKRTLDIRRKTLGPSHPKFATALNNLGVMYVEMGRYDDAAPCYERAIRINKAALGEDHPVVAEMMANRATARCYAGTTASALPIFKKACDIHNQNLVQNGWSLSEENALHFANETRSTIDRYVSAFQAAGRTGEAGPEALHDLADAILRNKGQVSDVMFHRAKTIVTETDPAVRALADSLRQHRDELSTLFVQGPGASLRTYSSKVKELSQLIQSAETRLAQKSASFRSWRESSDVSLSLVQEAMPGNSALIDYFFFQRVDFENKTIVPSYAALIVRKDAEPVFVGLGSAEAIDEQVAAYREHFRRVSALGAPNRQDTDDYREIGGRLYKSIWAPVSEFLDGCDLIFVCPDAALNLVSFAGLPADDGGYLIERYAIHYLSSGRDAIHIEGVPGNGNGLLALGDPDYDNVSQAQKEERSGPKSSTTRGTFPDSDNFRGSIVSPLPGTRTEVEQIAAKWPLIREEPVRLLFGPEASEDMFRREASGKRVIHLATHGYFIRNNSAPPPEGSNVDAQSPSNPLLLSGLFFAGANKRSQTGAETAQEDGVLTALEVCSLDLSDCQMVVLSACETGLGEPQMGEGVYGLRRAFHMAGARTVVSVLWQVSDRDAARFAGSLYERHTQSLPFRMRDLQMRIIKDLRANGQTDHPYIWAAFIAQGAIHF